MLRRLAARLAALPLQQGACSAASTELASSSPLAHLAASLQRLQLQPPSLTAAAQLGSRQFAAEATGGSGGGEQPPALASEQQQQQGPTEIVSASGQLRFSNHDEVLEAWGKAMDEGEPRSCTEPVPPPDCPARSTGLSSQPRPAHCFHPMYTHAC